MKQKYLFIFYILIGCILFSCNQEASKANKFYNLPTPRIDGFSPDNPQTGGTLTVNGENFSEDPEKISVYLTATDQFGHNPSEIPTKTISSSLTSVVIAIPDILPTLGKKEYTLQIKISSRKEGASNSIPITIMYSEPTKGWFYNDIEEMYFSSPPKEIYFPSNDIGYILTTKQYIYATKDGGISWKGNVDLAFNNAFAAFGNNAWVDLSTDVSSTKNGGDTWERSMIDTIKKPNFSGSIWGLYMSSPTKGQLLKGNRLYYINGSFAPEDIIPEFESIYSSAIYKIYGFWKMSNIDEFNLIIYGFVEYKDGQHKIIIAHKKDGIFNEYEANIPIPYNEEPKVLQLVTKDMAFLIDSNNNLFKLTGGTNWIKLNQKATALYFTDINTGYIGYNGKILKTTDGGNSWQDEFTLRTGDEIISITGKNGKLWALGTGQKGTFLVKYNP